MIDIPHHVSDEIFEKEFIRGRVILTELRFKQGQTKSKYLIILNKNPADTNTLFFMTTSKTEFYDKYPHVDHLRIKPIEVPFFKLETIIDCRQIHEFSRTELKRRYREGILTVAGSLPVEKMNQIDQLVAQSRFISLAHKKVILGWK